MKKHLLLLLVMFMTGPALLWAQNTRPVKVKIQRYKAEKCVRKTACVKMLLNWPVLSGGNARAVEAINDSIRNMVYFSAEADPSLPLPRALDTSMVYAYAMLKDQIAGMDDFGMSYEYELESKVLLQNQRYISIAMSNYSFIGGAHPNTYVLFGTYDLQTGRQVRLEEVIPDTLTLRSMLEKAFIQEKTEEGQPAPALSDILFEEYQSLPMPLNFAVTTEGVEFYYNPYEVAAYVFGPTDILFTWEQLGRLAEKAKWQ